MGLRRFLASALFATAAAASASAGELVFGVGGDDVLRDDVAGAFGVEIRSDPFFDLGPLELGAGAAFEIDGDGDAWGGAGFVAFINFGDSGWRLEGSEMVGAYHNGGGNDLGHGLEFRSQIGISYLVTDRMRVGAAFNHKSNAGLSDRNPGVETLFGTIGFQF